ncbi:hypothetical protein [Mesonia sp.]|nr:hypothetical protein [Mesonia sp.]
MQQNVKNTLYRFITMRAPERINETDKEKYFVQRPTGVNSTFKGLAILDTQLKEQASSYNSVFSSLKELKTSFGTFYDFAIWLSKHRATLSFSQAKAAFSSVRKFSEGIDQTVLQDLWNDLHYYVYVQKDPEIRDAIISILVANDFYNKVITKETLEDAETRRIAQARIILDLNSSPLTRQDSSNKAKLDPYLNDLTRAGNFFQAKNKIEDIRVQQKEIEALVGISQRINNQEKEQYDEEYNAAVEQAYKDAEIVERVVEDKETGKTTVVKEYQNLNLPTYNFKPRPELEFDKARIPSEISQDTVEKVENLKKEYNFQKFQGITEHLEKEVEEADKVLLDNSPKLKKKINYKGILLDTVYSNPKPGNFQLCFQKVFRSINEYRVFLKIGVPNDTYKVDSLLYTLGFADGTSNTNGYYQVQSYLGQWAHILSIKLFNNNKVTIVKEASHFEATVSFSNGEYFSFKHEFNGKVDGCTTLPIKWEDHEENAIEAPEFYGVQRLGIADYRKVEQEVCCYVPGEVSHIENIMAREFKEKQTRRLRRKEDTTTTSTENERESLNETTSTERFEMNQEMSHLEAEDTSKAINAGMSAEYAKIRAYADASYANNTASETSNHQAVTHAKELTEHALDRVVQRVKEERIQKIIEEYEETAKHGYDNREGDQHVSGVYRWVDKVYKNRIHNYGKRLMYEFMIPEPASFHKLAAKIEMDRDDSLLVEPVDPRKDEDNKMTLNSYRIDTNYKYWASIYNVEIEGKPKSQIKVGKSFSFTTSETMEAEWDEIAAGNADIDIPEGYMATKGYGNIAFANEAGSGGFLSINNYKKYYQNPLSTDILIATNINDTTKVPVSYSCLGHHSGNINFTITCKLTEEAKEAWRLKTFNAIIKAYEEAKSDYDEKLRQFEEERKALENNHEDFKANPGFYRKIEKDILRKNCIAYLIGHHEMGRDLLVGKNNATTVRPIQNESLNQYAAKVKFFEQAFEWDILSYHFYPFYWANKNTWVEKYQVENNDPLFRAFLQSGMARAVVSVKPGFEEAVNWFMATGQIWNGGQVPTIGDENYISIVDEIQKPESVVEETWETRVPTALTVIQAGTIGLNVGGLPCNPECGGNGSNPIAQTNNLLNSDNERWIEFTYRALEGGKRKEYITVGAYDTDSSFPRIYECEGQILEIHRDASWDAYTSSKVIFEKLAEKLSLIIGVKANQVSYKEEEIELHDAIRFRIDVNKTPVFTFKKTINVTGYDPELDDLQVIIENSEIRFIIENPYHIRRLLDASNSPLDLDDMNTSLSINRFLI